jgi:hypothetical protein
VIGQVRRNGQLAAVQGRITDAVEAGVGFDFQRDEIAARRCDDDAASSDFHSVEVMDRLAVLEEARPLFWSGGPTT